jgi:hypothetical protein
MLHCGPTAGRSIRSLKARQQKILGLYAHDLNLEKVGPARTQLGLYLNPRYPNMKRTMTIAPTHQMMLLGMDCSLSNNVAAT